MKTTRIISLVAIAAVLSPAFADEYLIPEGVNPDEARNRPKLTVTVVTNATSAAFRLDTREGPRASDGTETLAYSTRWHGTADSTVTILQDGEAIETGLAGESNYVWRVALDGTYTLVHETAGPVVFGDDEDEYEPETATFVVTGLTRTFAADDIVLTDYSGEYDGAPHAIGVATNAIEGLTLRYASGGGHGVPALPGGDGESALSWGSELPQFTGVTNVTVWVEASAPGYFTATNSATVKIAPRDIANATVAPIATIPFSGVAAEPVPEVTDGDPSIITEGDYGISYRNTEAPGEATLTLSGKNNYTGTKEVTFAIGAAELAAEIGWAYLKATGTYFAQLKVTCTSGLAAGVENLEFLFADRIGDDGKTEAVLWSTPIRAANPDTETRDGETYRRVALAPSLIVAESEPATYGVADLAAAQIPVAERTIEMYVRRRVVPGTGNEGAAKVGDFVGFVSWTSGGETKAIPVVADRSRAAALASLVSRSSLSSLPSPAALNAALAVGVPVDEAASPCCRLAAFAVEGAALRGVVEVGAQTSGATLKGALGANATVTLLGAASPGGPFAELGAVSVAADGAFEIAKPAGCSFFKLRLDIEEIAR